MMNNQSNQIDVTCEQMITLTIRVTVQDDGERATELADAVHNLISNFADPDDLMEKVEGWQSHESLVIEWGDVDEAVG